MLQDLLNKFSYFISGSLAAASMIEIPTWSLIIGSIGVLSTLILNRAYQKKMIALREQEIEILKARQ